MADQTLWLRDVEAADLPLFFAHQLDADANHMAAFTAKDPTDHAAFMAHWSKILADDAIIKKTIVLGDQVVGNIASYVEDGRHEVTYWLDKPYWGQGIATQALALLLREVSIRPLYARAVKDNHASRRVLEKCGFRTIGEDSGFANARNAEVEEWILILD